MLEIRQDDMRVHTPHTDTHLWIQPTARKLLLSAGLVVVTLQTHRHSVSIFSCITFDPSLVLQHPVSFLSGPERSRIPLRSSGPFSGPWPASSHSAPGPTALTRSPPGQLQHLQAGEELLNLSNLETGSSHFHIFLLHFLVGTSLVGCLRPRCGASRLREAQEVGLLQAGDTRSPAYFLLTHGFPNQHIDDVTFLPQQTALLAHPFLALLQLGLLLLLLLFFLSPSVVCGCLYSLLCLLQVGQCHSLGINKGRME